MPGRDVTRSNHKVISNNDKISCKFGMKYAMSRIEVCEDSANVKKLAVGECTHIEIKIIANWYLVELMHLAA